MGGVWEWRGLWSLKQGKGCGVGRPSRRSRTGGVAEEGIRGQEGPSIVK